MSVNKWRSGKALADLLNKTDGTMGSTKSLSPEDKRALVAYLKTL